MAVTYTKDRNYEGKFAVIYGKVTYASGDTSAAIVTGLSKVKVVNHSQSSVDTKYVSKVAVSGGTVTFTMVDPLAAAYFYYEIKGVF
jgi:hypothetical protein